MPEIKQMFEEMRNTWEEMKSANEKRDDEIKKFGTATQETENLVKKLNDRIDELESKLQRPGAGEPGQSKGGEMNDTDKAFMKYVREGKSALSPEERKALTTQTDPEGGYVVREEFRNQLLQKLRDRVFIRQYATIIQTEQNSVGVPVFDYEGDAEWTAENGQIGEENFANVFGKESFTPHKLARIFRIPIELIEDAVFDIENLLTDHFSTRFGEIEENAFINGDGVNKPLGLLAGAANYNQHNLAAGKTTIAGLTADDFIHAQMAIKAVYRNKGVWLTSRDVIKQARLLKDNDGRFIWQPGLQPGQAANILGRPTLESEYYPTAAAGDPALLYGDLSYYWIVDRTNISTQRLTEKYAEFDQVGVKLRKRTDAAPTFGDPFAVVNLAQA
jgi:HK97 family phage major capsid protein